MRAAGLDIGSRTMELVVVEDGRLVAWHVTDTNHQPRAVCAELVARERFNALVATGYGRGLAEVAFDAPTVTEIKAHGVGARWLHPTCRTVIDVGGQDTKVIVLDGEGRTARFEMNDRCAAGTGRFLEVMAQALSYEIAELGPAALAAGDSIKISSMCTVFAESEVVSLLAKGKERDAVARGVHDAIVERAAAVLVRNGVVEPVVFTGGGALNVCLRSLLEERLNVKLHVADQPQIVGALGAALIAESQAQAA